MIFPEGSENNKQDSLKVCSAFKPVENEKSRTALNSLCKGLSCQLEADAL